MTNAKPLVLVADDDPGLRRLIEVTLKNSGCEVTSVASGDAALAAIRALRPAVALLDVQMPGMSGWEVGKELKATGGAEHTTIVFLTSRTQEHDVLEGFRSGGSEYLSKPFSPHELKARIGALLQRIRA